MTIASAVDKLQRLWFKIVQPKTENTFTPHTTFGDIRIEERHNIHECGKKGVYFSSRTERGLPLWPNIDCWETRCGWAGLPLLLWIIYKAPHTTPPCLSSIGWQREHRHGDGGAAVDGSQPRQRQRGRETNSRATTTSREAFSYHLNGTIWTHQKSCIHTNHQGPNFLGPRGPLREPLSV